MHAWRVVTPLVVAPFVVAFACETTDTTSCAEQPEPQCLACANSPPNIAVCEQNQWVCPPTGPCSSPDDASSDAEPDVFTPDAAGDATTDAAGD